MSIIADYALVVTGAVSGFVSHTVGLGPGKYWQLPARLLIVVFGLAALGFPLFRLRLPKCGSTIPPGSTAGEEKTHQSAG